MKNILVGLSFVSLSLMPYVGFTNDERDSTADFPLSLSINAVSGWASMSGLTVGKNSNFQTLDIKDSANKAIDGTDFASGQSYGAADSGGFRHKASAPITNTFTVGSSGGAPTVGASSITLEHYKLSSGTETATSALTFTAKPLIMELDFAGAGGLKDKPLFFVFNETTGAAGASKTEKLDTSSSSSFDGWFTMKKTSGIEQINIQFKYVCAYQPDTVIQYTCAKDGSISSAGIDVQGAQSTKLGVKWNPTASSPDARHQKVFAAFYPSKLKVANPMGMKIGNYSTTLSVGVKVP